MGKGLVTGLITGVVLLVLAVIISFVIITNLDTVNEDLGTASTTATVSDEAGFLNGTGYTVDYAGVDGFSSPVITAITNATGDLISVANATISSAGVIINATALTEGSTIFNYTYKYKSTSTTVEDLIGNYTEGVNNISEKIPTILLIAAVVLIFSILLILWGMYQRMNVGSGGNVGGL